MGTPWSEDRVRDGPASGSGMGPPRGRVRDGPASGEDLTCLGRWAISSTTLQGRNQEKGFNRSFRF